MTPILWGSEPRSSSKSNARLEASRGRPSDRCDPWVPGEFLPQRTRFFLEAVPRASGQLPPSQLCPPSPSAQGGQDPSLSVLPGPPSGCPLCPRSLVTVPAEAPSSRLALPVGAWSSQPGARGLETPLVSISLWPAPQHLPCKGEQVPAFLDQTPAPAPGLAPGAGANWTVGLSRLLLVTPRPTSLPSPPHRERWGSALKAGGTERKPPPEQEK